MEQFLIQHKQAGKRYHRIDLEELKELRSDAVQTDKIPIYMINFDDEAKAFYLISENQFRDLEDMYRNA